MLIASGKAKDEKEAEELILQAIHGGHAFKKFKEIVHAQG